MGERGTVGGGSGDLGRVEGEGMEDVKCQMLNGKLEIEINRSIKTCELW